MKQQLPDLQKNLHAERLKLADLVEKSNAVSLELADAEAEHNRQLSATARDAVDAIFLERKPDASLPKLIAASEKKLAELRPREAAFTGAVTRQQSKVDELSAEIESRRQEAFSVEIGRAPRDILDMISELAARVMHVDAITRKHQRNGLDLAELLFPYDLSSDPYAAMSNGRPELIGAFNAALRVAAALRIPAKAA